MTLCPIIFLATRLVDNPAGGPIVHRLLRHCSPLRRMRLAGKGAPFSFVFPSLSS